MTRNSLFAMIGQWNDNPRQGTGVLLEFCGIKYFGWISRSAFISLDFDECTLCYFCHQHPNGDGGGGGDMGGTILPPCTPCIPGSPFYSILLLALFRLRNISIVGCCVIFSYSFRFPSSQNSYLPPSLLPPLTSVLPPTPLLHCWTA